MDRIQSRNKIITEYASYAFLMVFPLDQILWYFRNCQVFVISGLKRYAYFFDNYGMPLLYHTLCYCIVKLLYDGSASKNNVYAMKLVKDLFHIYISLGPVLDSCSAYYMSVFGSFTLWSMWKIFYGSVDIKCTYIYNVVQDLSLFLFMKFNDNFVSLFL